MHHVQDAVDRKDPLLPDYRKSCDEVWLLVYSEDSSVGSMLAGPWSDEEPIDGCVQTEFDRVYFLRSGVELFRFSTQST